MNIDGMPAIVTGGASGLGAATAAHLASKGARVGVLDLNAEQGCATADRIGGHFVQASVNEDHTVAAALDELEAANGTARILINCAGVAPPGKTVGREGRPLPLDVFRRTIEINLVGTFNMISQFAARLSRAEPVGEERGVVVNTASVAAFEGQIGQAAYSASKGGIVGITLPIARDLAPLGIRVVTIAPGVFLTPLLAGLPQEAQDSFGKQVPFPNRLGRPKEYAQLVESIVVNAMLNGETIRLDGAIRMAPK